VIDETRLKKYNRKIEHILLRISQIDEWTRGISEDEFVNDEMRKLATYKAFQEIVGSSMDIIAMICKDVGIAPEDDYTNIEKLEDRGFLDKDLANRLLEANRLRNILVHRYNKVNDAIAFESIKELITAFQKLVEVIKKWIKENLEI